MKKINFSSNHCDTLVQENDCMTSLSKANNLIFLSLGTKMNMKILAFTSFQLIETAA